MIIVDGLRPCTPNRRWRWDQACHMFSNGNLKELHDFAEIIGLKRAWFQRGVSDWSVVRAHYDLTPGMRVQALKAGAKEATREDIVAWLGRRTKPR
jgi:hypothetical protein